MSTMYFKGKGMGRGGGLLVMGFLWAGWGILPGGMALEFQEDFSADPRTATSPWQVVGAEALFVWNQAEQALDVTWDSSLPNSYFYFPLGATLTRVDEFSVSFELELEDIEAGLWPDKPFTFEIALGFIHLDSATNASFRRGLRSGVKNILEFNYFPAFSFYAPTVALTMVSSNQDFAYSHNFPVALVPRETYQVELSYAGAASQLSATLRRDGVAVPLESAFLGVDFSDFAVNAFAISSYSDSGADGSILAHGRVDNVRLRFPPPPVSQIAGGWSQGQWRVRFGSLTNWTYYLERTTSFEMWETLPGEVPGNGSALELIDLDPPDRGFYRVRANRQ